MSKHEYRVTWQREGQAGKRHVFYQTLAGAERCAKRQETARDEMTWLGADDEGGRDERPAPLMFGPVIQVREVGEWSP